MKTLATICLVCIALAGCQTAGPDDAAIVNELASRNTFHIQVSLQCQMQTIADHETRLARIGDAMRELHMVTQQVDRWNVLHPGNKVEDPTRSEWWYCEGMMHNELQKEGK